MRPYSSLRTIRWGCSSTGVAVVPPGHDEPVVAGGIVQVHQSAVGELGVQHVAQFGGGHTGGVGIAASTPAAESPATKSAAATIGVVLRAKLLVGSAARPASKFMGRTAALASITIFPRTLSLLASSQAVSSALVGGRNCGPPRHRHFRSERAALAAVPAARPSR